VNYRYISQQSELESIVPELMAGSIWGLDTETTGLDPHKDKVVLLQIGTKDIQYVLDMRKIHIAPLRPFLESTDIRKVCTNGKFDYKMIKGNYGIDTERIKDVYYTEKLLNVGRKFGGFGYDDLVKHYLKISLSKDLQTSFGRGEVPRGEFSSAQLEYAAKDVEHLIPVLAHQRDLLVKDGLVNTWQLECDALPCFADMEFGGMLIDTDKWRKLIDENLSKSQEIETQLNELAAQVVQKDLFGNIYVNWGSPDQITKVLQAMHIRVSERDPMTGKYVEVLIPNTNDKTLKKVKHIKVISLLMEHRHYMIRVNTFGYPYLTAINPVTGRLHPEIEQLGTETGRPANRSKKGSVNVLNIPKDKAFRDCFIAGPDEVIETHDFSGCELRIWAELSRDPSLTEAFLKGVDVHCYVASKLFKKEVTKKDPERVPAKTLNFGIAYGMGSYSMWEKMNGGGHAISLPETKQLYGSYGEEFAIGLSFLREAGKEALAEGYLVNVSGRRRYWLLPDYRDTEKYPQGLKDPDYKKKCGAIEREGGNFKIQSVNADITKYAMVLIRDYKKKNRIRTEFVNQIYDEIVTRTHKDDSPEFSVMKKKLMIEAAHAYLKNVPMEVDGEVGPCWAK